MKAITPVLCGLAGHGYVRVPVEQLPSLRRCPGPVAPDTLPASFLKNSDEQTVGGVAAVFHAIHENNLKGTSFQSWGVLAAPTYLGRNIFSAVLTRFAAEGAWGVSPHLIPHRSLHAMSGSISLALKVHGPNYGVSCGPGLVTEVLLSGAALLHAQGLPGVWVVLTHMEPEVPPIPSGQPVPGTFVIGLALALVPWHKDSPLARLRILAGAQGGPRDDLHLATLHKALERSHHDRIPQVLELDFGARLEIEYPAGTARETAGGLPVLDVRQFPAETER